MSGAAAVFPVLMRWRDDPESLSVYDRPQDLLLTLDEFADWVDTCEAWDSLGRPIRVREIVDRLLRGERSREVPTSGKAEIESAWGALRELAVRRQSPMVVGPEDTLVTVARRLVPEGR